MERMFPQLYHQNKITKERRTSYQFLSKLTSLRSLTITIPTNISRRTFQRSIVPLHELIIHDSNTTSDEVISESWAQLTSLRKLDYGNVTDSKANFILSSKSLLLLTSLHTLKISRVLHLSPDCFKSFPHLRTLHLHLREYFSISKKYFESNYGIHLSIIDSLKELQLLKLHRFSFLNCREIQEKYPHVRFLWKIFEPDIEALVGDPGIHESYFVGYYEGPFSADNKREGNGKMYYKDGQRRARYEGTFKNDMREGKGTFYYYDGSKYEGECKNHLREGKVIESSPEGWRYEGEYKRDFREGKGTMVYEDGERYEGEFKRSKIEGQGIYFFKGGYRYEGEFHNSVVEGIGLYFFPNGNRYEGQFHDGDFEGIIYYPNGNRYEGQFKMDDAVGRGTLIFANGEKYEGDAEIFDLENGALKWKIG